jgi:predicted PurR-regulated permease PerM
MDRERIVQLFFFGFLAVMAYELYQVVSPFIQPIAWSILLAFLIHPAFVSLRRLVRSNSLAAAIMTLAVTLLVIIPTLWLLDRLAIEAQSLYTAIPNLVRLDIGSGRLGRWLISTRIGMTIARTLAGRGIRLEDEIQSLLGETARTASTFAVNNASYVARNVLAAVIDFGIMIFTFFYMLRDGNYYYEAVRSLTPMHEDDKRAVFETLSTTLSAVMRGMMAAAVLQGLMIGLGYLICGVSYWAVLAILTAACGLLPFGGTAVIWIPVSIYLLYHVGWGWALFLFLWSTVAVAIIDNLIKPMTMRRGTGLPTLVLFFGIAGGLSLYGPLGLFAGPAIVAVFAALLRVYRRTYGDQNRRPPDRLAAGG